ncbi:MAG: coenzyme F420-0:L-glutamate ligase [Patescibacteria group bacterium]
MNIEAIKTRPLQPPKDDLLAAIVEALPAIEERSVVILASKVVSIWQGRCLLKTEVASKDELIQQEADWYLPRRSVPGVPCFHTLKNNLLVPSAGIDESNADGYYILWPKDLRHTTKELWQWFRAHYKVKEFGLLITDSHSVSLRRGVMGISLSHYGFAPLKDYRGEVDLFGRVLKTTQTNVADSLAAAAVLLMGEGSECTPLAVASNVSPIRFISEPPKPTRPYSSFEIATDEDWYHPLLASLPWQRGGGGRQFSLIHKK